MGKKETAIAEAAIAVLVLQLCRDSGLLGGKDVCTKLFGGLTNFLHDLSDASSCGLVAASGLLDVLFNAGEEVTKLFICLHGGLLQWDPAYGRVAGGW